MVDAIGKGHNKLAVIKFDLRRIALVSQVRGLEFDMRDCGGIDRLSERHIRLRDHLPVLPLM